MPKKLPKGVSSFSKLINGNYLFVDKTLGIKTFLEDSAEVALFTRPRRWGKTLMFDMLQRFLAPCVAFENTQGLFDTCEINRRHPDFVRDHQGKYPVIFITFKDVKSEDFARALTNIREAIKRLYEEHKYLKKSPLLDEDDKELFSSYLKGNVDEAALQNALLVLSRFLCEHHHKKKVYILIDEYDTPLNAAYGKYLEEITRFMKNMLSSALKDNPYLEKGAMTGILRVSKASMLSGLNNVTEYTLLNDETYQSYFGFTEAEVDKLLEEMELTDKKAEIQAWYDGYEINGVTLYNPWSIIMCLANGGNTKPYWINTADDALLKRALLNASADAQDHFQRLLMPPDPANPLPCISVSDHVRFEDLATDDMALWSLVLASGYLKVIELREVDTHYECHIAIPNREVRAVYKDIFVDFLKENLGRNNYRSFMTDLVEGKVEGFASRLGNYLVSHTSYFDFRNESNYHTFVLGLICSITDTHYLHSNIEAGVGRLDVVIIPKDTKKDLGIILEFKHAKRDDVEQEQLADEALDQIDAKKYVGFLGQYTHVKRILKVGAAFLDKSIITYHRVDDLENHTLVKRESSLKRIEDFMIRIGSVTSTPSPTAVAVRTKSDSQKTGGDTFGLFADSESTGFSSKKKDPQTVYGILGSEKIIFEIHPTGSTRNSCGFYALPIPYDRAGVVALLQTHNTPAVRVHVAPEIAEACQSLYLPASMETRFPPFARFREEQARLDEEQATVLAGVLDQIDPSREMPNRSLESVIAYLHDLPEHDADHTAYRNQLQDIQRRQQQLKTDLLTFCQSEEVFLNFIEDYVGNVGTLSFAQEGEASGRETSLLDVILDVTKTRLFVWQLDKSDKSNTKVKIVYRGGPADGQIHHMYHEGGRDSHFELMSESKLTSETTLGKRKREDESAAPADDKSGESDKSKMDIGESAAGAASDFFKPPPIKKTKTTHTTGETGAVPSSMGSEGEEAAGEAPDAPRGDPMDTSFTR